MKPTPILLAAALAFFLLPEMTEAQEPPNFSGAWSSQSPTRLSGGNRRGGRGGPAQLALGSGWGTDITIAQSSRTLQVQRPNFFARNDMQPPPTFVYALDGSESKNTVLIGRGFQQQVSTTKWDGDRLVITTIHTFRNPDDGKIADCKVRQTLALVPPSQPSGTPSLMIETMRSGVLGRLPSTTRTTYRRN